MAVVLAMTNGSTLSNISRGFEVMNWRFIIAIVLTQWLASADASAQAGVDCDVVACENEDSVKRPNIIDLEIFFRPAILKPKGIVVPKLKKKPVVITKRKPAPVVPKPLVIKKKPKPVVKTVAKTVVAKAKPSAQAVSWVGLPEVPVTVLLAEDFVDISGQYIIDLDPAALAAAGLDLVTISRGDLAARLGVRPDQIRSIQRRFLLSVVLGATPEQAAALSRNLLVTDVHADTKIKAAGGKLPLSWGLDRLDSPSLPLDGQFDRTFGDYDTRMYLFDSGVDRWHTEFGPRAKFGSSFVDALPHRSGKCREHGTEMASLIAGNTTGSAPKAEVIDLIVLPCSRNQTGEASSLIEAAEWLLIREADFGDGKPAVANMSLAGKWSRKINSAVSVLTKNGVVVVVAAGNNAQDACRFSPASAKDAITVAATDANDKTPGFSNYGQCVDINAPGRLLTTLTESKSERYVAVNGTSGAAALVSGLLARSLKVRGLQAASTWLADAAVPAKYWRKDQADLLLAQASPQWRKRCRTASVKDGVPLRLTPASSGKIVTALSGGIFVTVEKFANSWAYVRGANGKAGWVLAVNAGKPALLELGEDLKCSALP